MHGIAQASQWFGLALGVLAIAVGAGTLGGHQVPLPWLRQRVQWKRWGWAEVLLGLFLVLQTAPRLAGVSAGWAFLLSVVGLIPAAASIALQWRARLTHT